MKGVYIDTSILGPFRCREEVEALIAQSKWKALFEWRGNTYCLVMHEFLVSLECTKTPEELDKPSIKFRMFNIPHLISVDQLGNMLGFYTSRELRIQAYKDPPTDFPSEDMKKAFWAEITRPGVPWEAGRSHSNEIIWPGLQLLQRVLAPLIVDRRLNANKVYNSDLLCLWIMVNGTHINMGFICNRFLYTQANVSVEAIFVGPLLARLCQGYKLEEKLAQERNLGAMMALDEMEIMQYGIPKIVFPRDDVEEEMQPPLPPTFPLVPPHYATVSGLGICKHSNTNFTSRLSNTSMISSTT